MPLPPAATPPADLDMPPLLPPRAHAHRPPPPAPPLPPYRPQLRPDHHPSTPAAVPPAPRRPTPAPADDDSLTLLRSRQRAHLPSAVNELRRDGFKTGHYAWWLLPCDLRGRSEPSPPTYLTIHTAHIIQGNADSSGWLSTLEALILCGHAHDGGKRGVLSPADNPRLDRCLTFWSQPALRPSRTPRFADILHGLHTLTVSSHPPRSLPQANASLLHLREHLGVGSATYTPTPNLSDQYTRLPQVSPLRSLRAAGIVATHFTTANPPDICSTPPTSRLASRLQSLRATATPTSRPPHPPPRYANITDSHARALGLPL